MQSKQTIEWQHLTQFVLVSLVISFQIIQLKISTFNTLFILDLIVSKLLLDLLQQH
jgi:hypothetical protein